MHKEIKVKIGEKIILKSPTHYFIVIVDSHGCFSYKSEVKRKEVNTKFKGR